MRIKGLGIFGKVFIYTLLFLTLAIGITAGIFARQFVTAYEIGRRQQLADSIRPLVNQLQGRLREEMIELAQSFSEGNPAYQFLIQTSDGKTIYSTIHQENNFQDSRQFGLAVDQNTVLSMPVRIADPSVYEELIYRTAATLIILFISGTVGAAFFAQRMTDPIKKLAADTKKMSNLEPVPAPLQVLLDLHKTGTTIVVITHDGVVTSHFPRQVAVLDGQVVDERTEVVV